MGGVEHYFVNSRRGNWIYSLGEVSCRNNAGSCSLTIRPKNKAGMASGGSDILLVPSVYTKCLCKRYFENFLWSAAVATINSVIGIVGAHELMHRITGTGDLPFDPNNPSDLMSAENNPDAYNLFVNNGFQLTQIEPQQLNKVCLAKTPN